MWYLAWRYISFHKAQTLVLVFAISLSAFLPVATKLLLRRLQTDLRSRGRATPLLLGARGSQTDLTLHALYFGVDAPGIVPYGMLDELTRDGRTQAVPICARHTARRIPLVGTTLDYFDFRQMSLNAGRSMGRLGECVVGWQAARRAGIRVGDSLLTDNESFVDMMQYPLKLHVVGILAPTNSPDDDVVFCDVKTVWVIDGIGHGHQDVKQLSEPGVVLQKNDREVVAGAALPQYTEITPENEATFHFHGDMAEFPLTAIIVVPPDERATAILLGRWDAQKSPYRLVEPSHVVESLLAKVFRVKAALDVAAGLIAITTVLLIGLVVALSLRLRAAEMRTLFKLGCRRATTARLVTAELVLVTAMAAILLGFAMLALMWLGPLVLQWCLITLST